MTHIQTKKIQLAEYDIVGMFAENLSFSGTCILRIWKKKLVLVSHLKFTWSVFDFKFMKQETNSRDFLHSNFQISPPSGFATGFQESKVLFTSELGITIPKNQFTENF
jgi:hypothetical protein